MDSGHSGASLLASVEVAYSHWSAGLSWSSWLWLTIPLLCASDPAPLVSSLCLPGFVLSPVSLTAQTELERPVGWTKRTMGGLEALCSEEGPRGGARVHP